MNKFILAGDIGATKTILALYSLKKDEYIPFRKCTYPSKEFSTLEDVILTFLTGNQEQIAGACFGVAGPVVGNQAKVTNLPWSVDAAILGHVIDGAPVILANDLFSIANAIPYLRVEDIEIIKHGVSEKQAAIGVIAPGTGLGEAFLVWSDAGYRTYQSEGGHSSFAPQTPEEIELLQYFLTQYEHVSVERVCSGIGVPNIFEFLRDHKGYAVPADLKAKIDVAEDITPLIIQSGIDRQAEIAEKTLHMFLDILAGEAGNLALKIFALGGIYFAGGLSRHVKEYLRQEAFIQRFLHKGRLSSVLIKVPIYCIVNPEVALLGTVRLWHERNKNG